MTVERADGYEPQEISKDINQERLRSAETLLQDFLLLKKGERVSFVVDEDKQNTDPKLIQDLRTAAHAKECETTVLNVTEKMTQVDLEAVTENSDVIWVSWDFEKPDADWDAFLKKVEERGRRFAFCPGLKDETLEEGGALTEDLSMLEYRLEKMEQRLRDAVGMRITSNYGTDLRVELQPGKRRWAKDTGVIQPGHFDNLPGGEIFTTPDEENVNGRLVLPVLADDITKDQGVDKFVYLTIRNGKIAKIDGGRSAEKLRKYLQTSAKNEEDPLSVLQIAEIAFGANAKARSVVSKPEGTYRSRGLPAVEAEKRLGTMHFAFGDTRHGEEGTEGHTESDIHLDFVLPRLGLTVTAFYKRDHFQKGKNGTRLIDDGGWNFY